MSNLLLRQKVLPVLGLEPTTFQMVHFFLLPQSDSNARFKIGESTKKNSLSVAFWALNCFASFFQFRSKTERLMFRLFDAGKSTKVAFY